MDSKGEKGGLQQIRLKEVSRKMRRETNGEEKGPWKTNGEMGDDDEQDWKTEKQKKELRQLSEEVSSEYIQEEKKNIR